jgi:hypothetical protein
MDILATCFPKFEILVKKSPNYEAIPIELFVDMKNI